LFDGINSELPFFGVLHACGNRSFAKTGSGRTQGNLLKQSLSWQIFAQILRSLSTLLEPALEAVKKRLFVPFQCVKPRLCQDRLVAHTGKSWKKTHVSAGVGL